MSQSDRGRVFAVVTGVVGVTVFALFSMFVWDLSASQTRHGVEAERHAAQYAAATQQRIADDCAMSEPVAVTECVRQVIEAGHEHQRSEADLAAQRDMAKWAFGMIVVSAAGVLITGVGVIYVALTLSEARKTTAAAIAGANAAGDANATARNIGEAQVRAYLACTGATYRVGVKVIVVTLKVVNSGQSPTRWARVVGQLVVPSLDQPPLKYFGLNHAECGPMVSGGDDELVLSFDARHIPVSEIRDLYQGKWYISLECNLAWKDVFEREQPLKFFLVENSREKLVHPDGGVVMYAGAMTVSSRRPDGQAQAGQ